MACCCSSWNISIPKVAIAFVWKINHESVLFTSSLIWTLSLRQSDRRNRGLCVGLYAENEATLSVGIWWRENKNKLVEWKALVDTVGIKSADLEDKFLLSCFGAFRTSYMERPQTATCFVQWLGRLKCLATDLDASLSFLSTSLRYSRNRSPSRFPVSPMYNLSQ